ncbi:MAG: hypothetical protein IPJ79_11285 [Bacteroidetes bacterium]|nr:hypothetical protein [Bacteroidota bacterium]
MTNFKYCLLIGSIIFFAACKSTKKTTAPSPPVTVKPQEKPVEQPTKTVVIPSKINIALLLPLELKSTLALDTTDAEIKSSTLNNLQFYEGFILAVDSIRKTGKQVNVATYDSDIDSMSFINLLYKRDVMASDYIVCAANSNYVPAASMVAQKHNNKILFVQPVMQNNVVKENKDAWLALPANYTQSSLMASHLATSYPTAKFSIIFRDTGREKTWAGFFNDELKKAGATDVQTKLYSKAFVDSLPLTINKSKPNVFLIPSSDEAFVSPLLTKLNDAGAPNTIAAGLPTWETFESVDFSSYKNLKTLYFTSTFIDENNFSVKNFQKCFYKNYHTLPVFNAYLGFDMALFLSNLQFKSDAGIKSVLNYNFEQTFPASGFENRFISIVGIEDYKVVKKN